MTLSWPSKDTNEVLDYSLDWSRRLDGDTISTSTWTAASTNQDAVLTIGTRTNTPTTTTVWLSSGTTFKTYELTNRIVTAGGRTMDQTARITIKDK